MDILHTHSERVSKAHSETFDELENIKTDAENEMRAQASALNAKLVEAAQIVNDAVHDAQEAINQIFEKSMDRTKTALAENVAAIAFSGGEMLDEIHLRASAAAQFLATGKTPQDVVTQRLSAPVGTAVDGGPEPDPAPTASPTSDDGDFGPERWRQEPAMNVVKFGDRRQATEKAADGDEQEEAPIPPPAASTQEDERRAADLIPF